MDRAMELLALRLAESVVREVQLQAMLEEAQQQQDREEEVHGGAEGTD